MFRCQPYYPIREWDPQLTPVAQPKMNYLAPEYALTSACDTASDMFSIGVLLYALYNTGQPLLDSMNDWSKFKKNVSQVSLVCLHRLDICVTDKLRCYEEIMIKDCYFADSKPYQSESS